LPVSSGLSVGVLPNITPGAGSNAATAFAGSVEGKRRYSSIGISRPTPSALRSSAAVGSSGATTTPPVCTAFGADEGGPLGDC